MKNKDGIQIPESFLAENAERLKQIPLEVREEKDVKVIPLWIRVTAAAAVMVGIVLFWPQDKPLEKDIFADVTEVEIIELYEAGMIEFNEELIYEYTQADGVETEIELDSDDWDQLLNDMNEEELYNILEG